jgi:peroxiredoxin
MLVFYKEDCPTCRFALPYFDRLLARCRDRGVTGYLIAQEDAVTAAAVARELGLTTPQLLDASPYRVSRRYHILSVPTLLVINEKGIITDVVPAFLRHDLERVAATLSCEKPSQRPLFEPAEAVPELRAG